MTRKRKSARKRQAMPSTRRQWKIIAGIAVMAVVATVAVLVSAGASDEVAPPDNRVLATVNGAEITADEVARIQQRVLRWDNVVVGKEEVLEQLIVERVLYQEAEREGYEPTLTETEWEVQMSMAETGMQVEELHARLAEEGLSYLEYLDERRVQLAIAMFIEDAVETPEITEEEARGFYEYYRDFYMELNPGDELPPFEEMQGYINAVLQEHKRDEAAHTLIAQLRAQADVVVYP